MPARVIAETIADIFVREIFGTRRKDVIRLIITEGARFPKLAEFYYHEVIERVIGGAARACSAAPSRAANCRATRWSRFPQLLVAPALMALVWNGMFDRFAPLDVARADARASRSPVRRQGHRNMSTVMIRLALRASLACLARPRRLQQRAGADAIRAGSRRI